MLKKLKNEKLQDTLLWIFMVIGGLFTLFLIYKKDFYMENSDIASDMILGKLLSAEGGIMSQNWFYSTELHVIHTQLVYKLLFHIWPDNWLMVRLVAAVIFLVLIAASFMFMAKGAGLYREGLFAASILTWPFGQWYVRIVTFGQSYVTYFIIAFFSMGLFFRAVKPVVDAISDDEDKKENKAVLMVLLGLLAVVSFAAGLGGVRLLMICYAPLFAASLLGLLYAHYYIFKNKTKSGKIAAAANRVFVSSLVPFVFSCIGLFINRKVLCNKYNFQDQFRETWRNFSFDAIANTLTDAFTLFGWHANVHFVSWQGIINCLNFILLVLLVGSIIRVYKRLFRYGEMTQLFLLYVGTLTLITTVVLSCSNKYYSYYWLPVIPYFLLIFGIEFKYEESGYIRHYEPVIGLFVGLCVATASVSVYADPNPEDIYQDYAITDAIEWIKDTDYTDGFALFWSSNVIMALTDGRIDMHTVKEIDHLEDLDNEYQWLQNAEHTRSLPEGRFFVLVSARDYDLGNPGSADIFRLSDHLVYGTDSAYIYSFESMEDYLYAVSNAE
ncbi:hypothetical protein [Butyrivibrio sp. MC2021]|uniref:hypothetical protein n=1 Tax=Butyrivibrio sp. MC2021 TaxID=1408306 RepID=UPI000479ECC7|nr:hypothetical protein [Butyrivibrio sp. MC2021]